MTESENAQLFDDWPDRYEKWFTTPIGSLVRRVEWELVRDFEARPEDFILDAGCGLGSLLGHAFLGRAAGRPRPVLSMIREPGKGSSSRLRLISADILNLLCREYFRQGGLITALEFIPDARKALRNSSGNPQGRHVVVATLNSLSPWAERSARKGEKVTPCSPKPSSAPLKNWPLLPQ
jgi:hypothetical protein